MSTPPTRTESGSRARAGLHRPCGAADARQETRHHDSIHPTKGSGDIAVEINGGRADATAWFADFNSRFGWRALAILSDQRSAEHPDVPTLQELGHDVQVSVRFGFFTQAGTPGEIVATLSGACEDAVAKDRFKENMTGANRLIRYMSTEEFGPFFREAFELNGELLKEAGL